MHRGALVDKEMNPDVPEQPSEIAESAYACFNEGAADL
ncbi:MAG: 3-keto-5-aminohexanoate cleavage protein [Desulfatiglandales bacterium]|nr:3-keto-5-aminohexanoate cleavage protein [Desulfatiglandales bacterium]